LSAPSQKERRKKGVKAMKKITTEIRKVGILFAAAACLLFTAYCLPAAASSVADPMSIGVGARALGMGRAYVGVAEGGDALFMNPAGLALSSSPKLTSMYTSLMGDVNYAVVGGVYPYGDKAAIGAGIINSSVSDIMITDSDGTIRPDEGNWGSNILFLSAGTRLNVLPPFRNFNENILVGGSFKYYSMGGSGANDVIDAEDSSGNAYSADIGILYPATNYLTLGLNLQNVLSSKVNRSTGVDEDLSANLKVGGKIALIGRQGKAYTAHDTRRLYLNADYDLPFDGSEGSTHVGLEFWPIKNLALRTGMDGDDITAGIGVRLAGLEFNYAYHPFDGIGDNTSHFFSIGYVGQEIDRELAIHIDNPKDKSIIYEDHAKVSGRIEVVEGDDFQAPAGEVAIKVNGVNIPIADDLTFSAEVPVDKLGKKLVVVEATDTAGDYTEEKFRLVRLISFEDVPDGYWAKMPIENTGTVGLVEGYPDKTFRPDRALTRAELATLLVRAKQLPLPMDRAAAKVFTDVDPDHWAAKYLEVAKRAGLVKGYPDGTFRPNNKINKAEGITVLVRFEGIEVAQEAHEKPYWDVNKDHWAARYIQSAKELGMLKYVEKNYLHPNNTLARAEAVEMLSKTSLAGGMIKDLYSWEKGFKRETIPERPTIKASVY
jgi:hypothetical protein